MDKLIRVAEALLKVETIDGKQFEALYNDELDAETLSEQIAEEERIIEEENAKDAAERDRMIAEAKSKANEMFSNDKGNVVAVAGRIPGNPHFGTKNKVVVIRENVDNEDNENTDDTEEIQDDKIVDQIIEPTDSEVKDPQDPEDNLERENLETKDFTDSEEE